VGGFWNNVWVEGIEECLGNKDLELKVVLVRG